MKKLVLSLIFPFINIAVSLVLVFGTYHYLCSFLCLIAGGIVPVILTLFFKVDTGKYIKDILYFMILSFVAFFVSIIIFGFLNLNWLIIIVLIAAVVITDMYFWAETENKKEQAVLFLLNPVMYFAIFIISIVIDINVNGLIQI